MLYSIVHSYYSVHTVAPAPAPAPASMLACKLHSALCDALGGNFSQSDQHLNVLNGTETSLRGALISNSCHLY